ncbi:g12637 [Coccomyxa viridis]|uniref:G12637 protein n=1 Tax=Coccomyxa viridis TaxID=1274662 RepID=A0ABP1GEZ2_9CHLO
MQRQRAEVPKELLASFRGMSERPPARKRSEPLASKEDALIECSELHRSLIECYRTASIFGWPCKDENKAFWDCYTRVRGVDSNIVGDTLSRWAEKLRPATPPLPEQTSAGRAPSGSARQER